MSEDLNALTRNLINAQIAFEELSRTADNYRGFLNNGRILDLSGLDMARQYKSAYDAAESKGKELRTLIDEVEAAYPPEIVWAAKTLGKPIFLLRLQNRNGYYALVRDELHIVFQKFKVEFIPE